MKTYGHTLLKLIIPALCVGILSCSCTDDAGSWTSAEKEILNLESRVVPVLSVADADEAEFLRRSCLPLSGDMIGSDLYGALVAKMKATVTDPSQDGVGIAGPQVGIGRRVVCVQRFDKEGEPFEVYPNIRITSMRGDKVRGPEGCLSVPDRRGEVLRSRDIDITYTSVYSMKDTVERVQGFTAVIFQHECDHLDGILYTDRLWSEDGAWFAYEGPDAGVRDDRADVFYLVSTNIVSETGQDGKIRYQASLSQDQKDVLSKEIGYVAKHVFCDSLNFFSPFYHQHTMDALGLSVEDYTDLKRKLAAEVYEAFSYYMDNFNNGRPFILAGFSQGAMLVKEILKRMTPEQYSRMAAAYVMGWGVNSDDMKYPCIKPAQSADDRGVTVSYNTVSDVDGIWHAVMDNAVCCINPVNWKQDCTPAEFQYGGKTLTATVDTSYNVVVVNGFEKEPLPFAEPWPGNCLHHYEFIFFANQLKENAKLRAYGR